MRRLGLFSALAGLASLLAAAPPQPQIVRENGRWVKTIRGSVAAQGRLRVNAHGPVTLEGGVSNDLSYTARVSVNARSETEARRLLDLYRIRVDSQGGWTVVTATGGAVLARIALRAPRLGTAVISTSDGAVQATGIDGPLEVDTRAGELSVDRVRGDCKLSTGGGELRAGEIGGTLQGTTGAGAISVKRVGGDAILGTNGGDIVSGQAGGSVRAETGGGDVRIGTAGGSVTAVSGGGRIVVENAKGVVTVRNMAGPVQVGSAAGVRCESGNGGIRVSNIAGPMRVSTSMGSILATLLAGNLAESYLSTGNGDITVLIPSNVGVTIQAQNNMSDTLRRIVSDFREIPVRRQGPWVVAQGSVNGGGPLVQILGMGGTIFIKREK